MREWIYVEKHDPKVQMKELGKRLRKLREEQNLSSLRLGAMSGVNQSFILRLELEKTINPSVFMVGKLADALGVTIYYLIGGTEHEDAADFVTGNARAKDVMECAAALDVDALSDWLRYGKFLKTIKQVAKDIDTAS